MKGFLISDRPHDTEGQLKLRSPRGAKEKGVRHVIPPISRERGPYRKNRSARPISQEPETKVNSVFTGVIEAIEGDRVFLTLYSPDGQEYEAELSRSTVEPGNEAQVGRGVNAYRTFENGLYRWRVKVLRPATLTHQEYATLVDDYASMFDGTGL